MDSFPETEYYQKGFSDGIKYGKQKGREEMLLEGEEYGRELGIMLSTIYTDLHTLTQKICDEKKLASLHKLMQDILEYPLDNETDPLKEGQLERIKNKYRELTLLYGLETVSISTKSGKNQDLSF
jgi:predicted transposase YdaD